MSEFLSLNIAIGKRRYYGAWAEVGGRTLVCYGSTWDCAPTLRQPPRRVAEMLLKRMVETGAAGRAEAAAGLVERLSREGPERIAAAERLAPQLAELSPAANAEPVLAA